MLNIPECIKTQINDVPCTCDDIGLSGSTILLFPDKVLKIQEHSEEAVHELRAMEWLQGRIAVPKVLAHAYAEGKSYLLMSKMKGRMACSEYYLEHFRLLVEILARALEKLWEVPISDCPLDCSLDQKLRAAEFRVTHNLVDCSLVEPETFGPGGFQNPQELLQWLKDHRPEEEPVLSHGDFCLPNLFVQEDGSVSFIDLGRCGAADKWQDLALCFRSLRWNSQGEYGGKIYPENDPLLLFKKLGMEPDREKLRYYTLLDELF